MRKTSKTSKTSSTSSTVAARGLRGSTLTCSALVLAGLASACGSTQTPPPPPGTDQLTLTPIAPASAAPGEAPVATADASAPSAAPTASTTATATATATASSASGGPDASAPAAAKTCTTGADCGKGQICAGEEGCDKTWTCKPSPPCTRDLRTYCGCDGKTFQGSGSCPGQKYKKKSAC